MAVKRTALLLGLTACAVVVALLLLIFADSGLDRSGRSAEGRGADSLPAGGPGAAGGADSGQTDGIADEARIRELIERYGGFSSGGLALLTRPEAPGAGLDVVLRATVEGSIVERRTSTDATGTFALPEVPRVSGYVLSIEGDRTQPFRLDLESMSGVEKHDFGELRIDRFYFVVGRVVAGGSKPVKDAVVSITEPSGGGSFSFRQAAASAAEADRVLADARTGTDGRYRIRLRDPGILNLRVEAEGWASHYHPEVVVGLADAKVDVALIHGEDVVGYVLDAAGRPVAEAGVALTAMTRGRWWSPSKQVTRTDGTGRFGFRVEPMASMYTVQVVPRDGIDMSRTIELPLSEDLVMRLPGTGVLTGRVLDAETKQPIAGADVLVGISKDGGGRRWGMPDFSKALRTDEYGVWKVNGVGEGTISSISVRATGFEDLMASAMGASDQDFWRTVRKVELKGEAETRIPDVNMDRGRLLAGMITEAGSGRPVSGAVVQLWDFVMGNRATITDASGAYRFDGVGDRVAMIVEKEGYAPFREAPWPGHSLAEEGDEAIRDLEISLGGTVEGRVRTTAGQPVPKALVRLRLVQTGRRNWTQAMNLRNLWTYTDEEGRYSVSGVPPIKLQAQVEASGYDTGVSKEKEVKAGQPLDKMDVTLNLAASAEGRVVDREGKGIGGAHITIAKEPKDAEDTRSQWRALMAGKSAFAGTNGRFVLDDIPVGDLLVRVEADEYAVLTKVQRGVEPGARLENLRFEMAPAFAISGKIINAQGEPITWCWVRARQTASPDGEPSSQLLSARVESDGSFRIPNVPAGAYRVEVRVSNWAPNVTRYRNQDLEGVSAGTENLRLVLDPADDQTSQPGWGDR